jgi:Fe-S-cluster containining protein
MKNKESWYKNGLSFECTGCGKCCSGKPGFVWVNHEEIRNMANFLKISETDFLKKYIRRVHHRLALVEFKKNHDCVFLRDNKCLVYGARPTQCKTFPWWPQILESKDTWEEAALECEGMRKNAPLVDANMIEEQKLIQIRRNEDTS